MSDDTLRTVLNAMATGNAGLPLQDVLAQIGGDDPRMQMLAEYMAKRQEQLAAPTDLPEEQEYQAELAATEALQQAREQQASLERVERTLHAMHQELETLRERNDTFAAALGACYLCWGEDAHCPECGGRGQPGSALPDAGAYNQWVVPAVRRVQRRREMQVAPSQRSANSRTVARPSDGPPPVQH